MSWVLILGATGGIGSALAHRLAAAGYRLFLTARDAGRLAALARALGAEWQAADLREEAALKEVIQLAAAASGNTLDGLACCVGSVPLAPLKQLTAQDFIDAFRLNALIPALAVREAEAALRRARGSVVLVSSIAVAQGFPQHSAIAAAKGAVEGLTRALAAELAPDVRVNAVAPSLVRTPLTAALVADERLAQGIARFHALARLGEPQDVAAMMAFLLSPESGWITGQVVAVDGGRSRVRNRG